MMAFFASEPMPRENDDRKRMPCTEHEVLEVLLAVRMGNRSRARLIFPGLVLPNGVTIRMMEMDFQGKPLPAILSDLNTGDTDVAAHC